ncbi:MAG: hypothetical protein U9Q73_00935 [Nanoarchaeota archaeon]|nr:hypothetical protein [Nanoarchaeota archaeon]
MKKLTKIIAGAGIFAGLVGGAYLNSQGSLIERGNLVYQGYHVNKEEGSNILVFDDKLLERRYGTPDLTVVGDPKGLEIGKEYDVKIKSPRWFGEDVAVSVERRD